MWIALGVNFPPKFCLLSGSHRFGFGALNLEELKGVDVLGGDADFCPRCKFATEALRVGWVP
jgi:hypothetical protein